jgi:beta-lactam-binding protein with PASTA domain
LSKAGLIICHLVDRMSIISDCFGVVKSKIYFLYFSKTKRRSLMRKKLRNYLLIVVSFFAVLLLMDKVVMPFYVGSVKSIEMPNLIGKKFDEARKIIDSLNLKLESVTEKHDARFPVGYVILQSPRPGMKIKEGRRVYLVVSSGEQKIEVPNLVGKSVREAKLILEKSGLKLGELSYDFSDEIPEGAIISQSIPEKSKVSSGTFVSVVVSLGNAEGKVQVPNLIGLPFSKVEQILNEAGLRLGKVVYEPSSTVLPNTVIEQFPRPGTYIQKGSAVDVFIAKEISSTPKQNY